MFKSTVLLTSSDQSLIDLVRSVISPIENLRLETLATAGQARKELGRGDIPLVIVHLDENGTGTDVSGVIQAIAGAKSATTVLVLADRHKPAQALALLRLGVVDYLARPLDLGRLAYLVDVLTIRARADRKPVVFSVPVNASTANDDDGISLLDPPNSPMGRIMDQLKRIAGQDTTILLGGETGTGKSRIAGMIHRLSKRRDEPFLTINCGALSASLIESEMFGHVKGAFTGADADRIGKFAAVGNGTLFLDEVDSLPLELQAKLLRAVEDRVFEPVGSNKTQPMRARLIAACNRPLEGEIAAGRFRSDLYYRLNVYSLVVPPLRDRPVVLERLTERFVEEFCNRAGQPALEISEEAKNALAAHNWPGNIRELRNVIECTVALCPDQVIHMEDLPVMFHALAPVAQKQANHHKALHESSLAQAKDEAEFCRISETLERHKNNRLRAAAELGISRMTLYNKLRKYGPMLSRCGN